MVVINSLPCFCFAMHMRKRSGGFFLSRALSKTKVEVSVNQSGTLNESKPKEQHEFSERDKQRILTTNIAILHKLWYTYGQGI